MPKKVKVVKTKKPTFKKSYRKKYSAKVFEKKVQKVINKNVEDKQSTAQYPITSYNQAISSTGDIVGIMPVITNGTGENSRVGNDIYLKNLKLYVNISHQLFWNVQTSNTTYAPSSRILYRVMIVQPKTVMNRTDINNNQGGWLSRLLRNGNSSVPFDGTLDNFYLPINTEAITKFYDKKFSFCTNTIYMPGTNTQGMVIPSNMSFKRLVINLKRHKHLLKYDASFDTQYPTNFNPVILLGYCYIDGTVALSTTTDLKMNFMSMATFQDP